MDRRDIPLGMGSVRGALHKQFAIYVLTNRPRGVLHTRMSSSLAEVARQHRQRQARAPTSNYDLTRLVYFECFDSAAAAILRQKRLERWRREWLVALIEEANPTWRDLWPDIAIQ